MVEPEWWWQGREVRVGQEVEGLMINSGELTIAPTEDVSREGVLFCRVGGISSPNVSYFGKYYMHAGGKMLISLSLSL